MRVVGDVLVSRVLAGEVLAGEVLKITPGELVERNVPATEVSVVLVGEVLGVEGDT